MAAQARLATALTLELTTQVIQEITVRLELVEALAMVASAATVELVVMPQTERTERLATQGATEHQILERIVEELAEVVVMPGVPAQVVSRVLQAELVARVGMEAMAILQQTETLATAAT